MKTSKRVEKLLFTKIQKKDKQAFMEAYDLYLDQIFRFIYFKVGSKEEAEDISSAVFLKTWGYLQENEITDYNSLKSLFYTTARNLIIDHYRKVSRQENMALDGREDNFELADEKHDLEKQTEITFDIKLVEDKLGELKDEYREVIVLRYINELSISEIAEILNKPKGNVRVLIHRALNALRELME